MEGGIEERWDKGKVEQMEGGTDGRWNREKVEQRRVEQMDRANMEIGRV